jgi:hypothetical protein
VTRDLGGPPAAEIVAHEQLEIRSQRRFLGGRGAPQPYRRHLSLADRGCALADLERHEEHLRQLLARVARHPGFAGDGHGVDVADGGRFEGNEAGSHRDRLELDAERGEIGAVGGAAHAELAFDDLPRPAFGRHRTDGDRHAKPIGNLCQARADQGAGMAQESFALGRWLAGPRIDHARSPRRPRAGA